MHARLPKNYVLEARLERYADAIEVVPGAYKGRWAEACWPLGGESDEGADLDQNQSRDATAVPSPDPDHGAGASAVLDASPTAPPNDGDTPCSGTADEAALGRFREVRLDLGCGKGAYIIECARRAPDVLFLGVDFEPVCIARAAEHIMEGGVRNAVVIPGSPESLGGMFAPGELSGVSINFPTPEPKRRHASERLVTADHLLDVRPLLSPDGTVTLRTDSLPLFSYALPQFEGAGYDVLWTSADDRADHPDTPFTEYEERLSEEGATVYALEAAPAAEPPTPEQVQAARDLPQSLYDYLPDDLFEGEYVPHGMGYAMTNMRNCRANEERRTRKRG